MIRIRLTTAITAAALLALPTAAAAGSPTDRATGGGQFFASTDMAQGPGSTIAFTAQGDESAAKGQIQFIDRALGTGQSQQRSHYSVDCLVVDGSTAIIGATERDSGESLTLYVTDNGQGSGAEDDVIAMSDGMGSGPCGSEADDEDEVPTFGLARGNAQVHDADGDA